MTPDQERFLVRNALLASFGLTVFLGVVLVFAVGGAGILVALVAAFVGVLGLFFLCAGRGLPIRWFVAVALLNLFVVVPELALRLVDFRHGPKMEFGYPDPATFQAFVRDPELFWKNPPGSPGFNSWGFRGPEVALPKPEGVLRVVFLGDSCTAIGQPANYPMAVEARLNAADRSDGRRFEVVNLAVPGYSTHQGVVLARKYGAELGADVVFVYYGWNDHWQAYGVIDADKVVPPRSATLTWANQKLRVFHLARWALSKVDPSGRAIDQVRVPPEHYRQNLEAIVGIFRDQGVPVVLVTAPTAFYRFGVPAPLVEKGFLPDADEGIRRHRAYSAMTREVARQEGARLLDLEERYDESDELRELFLPDAIHFTATGRERVARDVAAVVLELVPAE